MYYKFYTLCPYQCWDPKWYPIWDPKNRWDPIWDPKWYLVLGIPFSGSLPSKIWGWDYWDGRPPSDFVYGLLTNEPWRIQKSHPIFGIPRWDHKSHPKSQVGIPKLDPNAQHCGTGPIGNTNRAAERKIVCLGQFKFSLRVAFTKRTLASSPRGLGVPSLL